MNSIRINIDGKGYIVQSVSTRVSRPVQQPDYEPCDLIEDRDQMEGEPLFKRLADAHGAFVDALGKDARNIRTLTRGFGTPEGGDARCYRYLPLEWIDFTQADCDNWTLQLQSEADSADYRLCLAFLTTQGFLSSLNGNEYKGLPFKCFSVDETVGIVTTSATGADVDADGKTDRPEYALLVSCNLERVLTVPDRQTDTPANNAASPEPKREYKQWPDNAQRTVAALWESYRKHGGTRERDCYDTHKDRSEVPDCIKGYDDFQKCKEAAEKHGLVSPLHKKQGKNKGKPCQ